MMIKVFAVACIFPFLRVLAFSRLSNLIALSRTQENSCRNFPLLPRNDPRALNFDTDGFHSRVDTAGDGHYSFSCENGQLSLISLGNPVTAVCPKIFIGSNRTVIGKVAMPPISYQYRSCTFSARASVGSAVTATGHVEGTAQAVYLDFKIVSIGLRWICSLGMPRLLKNYVYFPSGYFVNGHPGVKGLSQEVIREGIMQAINRHLVKAIKKVLGVEYKCESFFKIVKNKYNRF